jgi:uncharacterized protein (TIGR02217 family)
MAFHDVSLPEDFEYQGISGAGFSTIVQETASGHEFRVARQSQGRHRFRLRKALQTPTQAQAIKAFGLGRRGSLHSFRLKDWADYSTATDGKSAPSSTDTIIGTGNGTVNTFQLIKVYDPTGAAPYQRTITLPVSNTVTVSVDGVTLAASDFTVSSTGEVTLDQTPSTGVVVRAGCEFDVPVRFESNVDQLMQLQADAFDVWSLPQLDCIEVLSEVEQPERWFSGGATDHGAVSATQRLTLNDGMFNAFAPSTNVDVYLPAVNRTPGGGQVFVIHNKTGSAGDLQMVDDTGTDVGTAISAGNTKTLALARGSSTAAWVLY